MPNSSRCPFIPGEEAPTRHRRRLRTAVTDQHELKAWCEHQGIEVRIRNQGHHWIFLTAKGMAEWWPSSARLVFNQKWSRDLHLHDVGQVRRALDRAMRPGRKGEL